jgi:hypothetical protein
MKKNKFSILNSQFSIGLSLLALLALLPSTHAQGLRGAASSEESLTATNAWTAVSRKTTLYTVSAANASSGDLYLMVFDATSTPSAGTVPALPGLKIPSGSVGGWDFNVAGCPFANGVVVATSTTPVTFTNGSASFQITVTHTP